MVLLWTMEDSLRQFRDEVLGHSARVRAEKGLPPAEQKHLTLLKSDGVVRIAQFFLIAKTVYGSDPGEFRIFLERHNEDMKAKIASGALYGSPSRFLIPQKTIDYVVHEMSSGQIRIEQSVLLKVFVESMSSETCRSILAVLAEGRLLQRYELRSNLYAPIGALEEYFLQHLNRVMKCVRSLPA